MEEAKWYVAHTFSGYENKVASNIETVVENRNLHDWIQDVVVPTETVVEIKDDGTKKEVERKIFPGYVLIKMVMNDDSWYVVRNTRGCTGFVGPESKPVPLTEEEVRKLGVEKVTVRGALRRRRSGQCDRRPAGGLLRHCGRHRHSQQQRAGHRFHVWARNIS